MYTDVKSVRILIALMKAYNIKDAVLSSGTCSIPVLQSLESDGFFNCYSDVDERSAVYLAIGIAQANNAPVAVVCTSGTAACNYLPGICEARKLCVPLLIITCDKDPYTLGHLTIQKINQEGIYSDNCKFSVTLPVIKDNRDEWAVKTMITKSILELDHHGKGPVHINIYTDGDKKTFETNQLPIVSKVDRYDLVKLLENKAEFEEKLTEYPKILILIGEGIPMDDSTLENLQLFCQKYGAYVSAEYVANIQNEIAVNTYRLTEQLKPTEFIKTLKPDLVISMGGNYASYEIKTLLIKAKVIHWWVDPNGEVVDVFRSIDRIIECSPKDFFGVLAQDSTEKIKSKQYIEAWNKRIGDIIIPESEAFTSMYVVDELCKHLDKCKVLHLGILNSTRLVHLFDIPKNIRVYSNLGALGIDGSLSTFLGQASIEKEGLCICLIGDLSFLYDMNALYGINIPDNIRIVLLNNKGGSEFHLNTGIDVIPTLDNYISAGHNARAEGWVKSLGINYYSASNKNDFSNSLINFLNNKGPSMIEVFTDMEMDAQAIKNMYTRNGYTTSSKQTGYHLKKILRKMFGVERTQKIVKMAKIWREK